MKGCCIDRGVEIDSAGAGGAYCESSTSLLREWKCFLPACRATDVVPSWGLDCLGRELTVEIGRHPPYLSKSR